MKRHLCILTIVLLVGCSPTGPDTPIASDSIETPTTIDDLAVISAKMAGNRPLSPLTVVAEAAVVCREVERGGNGVAGSGHHSMSWWDNGYLYEWHLECWQGSPSFPGSEAYDACASTPAMDEPLDCEELVDGAWRLVRAMVDRDGYSVVSSDLQRDVLFGEYELKNYKIWFTDPSGNLWYWNWIQQAGIGAPSP